MLQRYNILAHLLRNEASIIIFCLRYEASIIILYIKSFSHIFATFVYQEIRPLMLFICGHWCHLDLSRVNGGFRGVGMQGVGYDMGSKFARGGISVAAVTVVCYNLTIGKMEAERAELIAIILNVAEVMHHIFRCIHKRHLGRLKEENHITF